MWYDSVVGCDGKVYGIPLNNENVLIVDMNLAIQNIDAAGLLEHPNSSEGALSLPGPTRPAEKQPSTNMIGLFGPVGPVFHGTVKAAHSAGRRSSYVDTASPDWKIKALLEAPSIVAKSEFSVQGNFKFMNYLSVFEVHDASGKTAKASVLYSSGVLADDGFICIS